MKRSDFKKKLSRGGVQPRGTMKLIGSSGGITDAGKKPLKVRSPGKAPIAPVVGNDTPVIIGYDHYATPQIAPGALMIVKAKAPKKEDSVPIMIQELGLGDEYLGVYPKILDPNKYSKGDVYLFEPRTGIRTVLKHDGKTFQVVNTDDEDSIVPDSAVYDLYYIQLMLSGALSGEYTMSNVYSTLLKSIDNGRILSLADENIRIAITNSIRDRIISKSYDEKSALVDMTVFMYMISGLDIQLT